MGAVVLVRRATETEHGEGRVTARRGDRWVNARAVLEPNDSNNEVMNIRLGEELEHILRAGELFVPTLWQVTDSDVVHKRSPAPEAVTTLINYFAILSGYNTKDHTFHGSKMTKNTLRKLDENTILN